jgi:diguanylate cyclase (GGDEF)-like protein/PAS domain S-box-containing protein
VQFDFTPGIVLPALATPIALALAWRTWRFRALPGATPFIFIAGIAVIWSAFNAMELATVGLQGKLVWNDLQYIAIVFMPVAWLVMALDYTGRRSWLTVKHVLALLAFPIITLALLWTNQYHHLMRTTAWLDTNGSYAVLGRTFGVWFWIHTAYSYFAAAAATLLLLEAARRVPPHYRGQPLMLLAGFAVPLAWNITYVLFPGVLPRHDFTPAIFGIAGIIVMWGLSRFRLFTLVPVARHALVENMADGLLVLDEAHRVVDFNDAARKLIGQPGARIFGRPLAETWDAWTQLAAAYRAGMGEAPLSLLNEGSRRDYEVKMSSLTSRDHVIGRLLVIHDVTERSLMEESLRRQALTDSLTGLPNRTLFMARLDDAVRQVRRTKTPIFAVMVLDLDRFKLVNDSIGHLAGDFLLENVASKLKRCVRDVDVVARMGGDEFMILVHGVTTALDVLPVVERIQSELGVPIHLAQQEIASSASIGVAIWEEAYGGPEEVLRAADTAMYQAKEAGGSCYRIFDEMMHESVLRALKAEIELRSAVKREEFVLVYQPIVDLSTGAICSLEALIRWRHQEHGTILPGEFIEIAERSGLIVPLGALALEEVCSQLSRWRAPGCQVSGLPVSLNVSPRQLIETDFVNTMLACMDEWRVSPQSIILEVTETALVRDPLKSKQVMMELREAGIRLCLDDFGTGWSSLRHLTTFPVQHLKIDRSFISKIAGGSTEFEIVRSIISLAHSIGLEVTGEGVEEEEQLRLLTSLGCDHAQGYFIGRPMAAEALSGYVGDLQQGDGARRDYRRGYGIATAPEGAENILPRHTGTGFASGGLA